MRATIAIFGLALSWDPAPPKYNVTNGGATVSSIFPSDGPVYVAGPNDVLEHRKPVLVNYYSEYCPHCWYFAVTLTRVADAIRGGDIDVVAVNCGDKQLQDTLCDKANIYVYPTLMLYGANYYRQCRNKPCTWKGAHDSAQDIISWLQKKAATNIITHPEALQRGNDAKDEKIVRAADPPGKDGWEGVQEVATVFDRWSDALAAFTQSLRDHYRVELYSETRAVVEYVAASLPGNRGALDALAKNVAEKKYASREEMAAMLDGWSTRWQVSKNLGTCKNPSCALWTLFHVCAAANAARLQDSGVGRGASPEETVGFVHTMVLDFFGCERCIEHFERMYDGPARHSVQTGKDAVLWLWEAHQRVNLRVAAQNGVEVDRRWPPYKMCPACWRSDFMVGRKLALRHLSLRSDPAPSLEVAWSDLSKPFDIQNVYMQLLQTYVGLENVDTTELRTA